MDWNVFWYAVENVCVIIGGVVLIGIGGWVIWFMVVSVKKGLQELLGIDELKVQNGYNLDKMDEKYKYILFVDNKIDELVTRIISLERKKRKKRRKK